MKFYVVVFVDSEIDGKLVTKGYYETLSSAEEQLKNHALELVKKDGGERQEKVAFQNDKELNEIQLDTALNNGLYLKDVQGKDGKKMVYVYEKGVEDTGRIFSSIQNYIKSKGLFTITEIDFDVPERFSCGCNVKRTVPKKSNTKSGQNSPIITFADELKKLFNSGGPQLKSVEAKKSQKKISYGPDISYINDIIKGVKLRPTKTIVKMAEFGVVLDNEPVVHKTSMVTVN